MPTTGPYYPYYPYYVVPVNGIRNLADLFEDSFDEIFDSIPLGSCVSVVMVLPSHNL